MLAGYAQDGDIDELLDETNIPERLSDLFELEKLANKASSAPTQISREIDRVAREVYAILSTLDVYQHYWYNDLLRSKVPHPGSEAFPIYPFLPDHIINKGFDIHDFDESLDWDTEVTDNEIPKECLQPLSRAWAKDVAFKLSHFKQGPCKDCRFFAKEAAQAVRVAAQKEAESLL